MHPSHVQPWRAVALVLGLSALVAASAQAQAQTQNRANPETTPRDRATADSPVEPGMLRLSDYGESLSDAEASALLVEMRDMTQQVLAVTRAAEQAGSVAEVKSAANRVFELAWGQPSGIAPTDATGAVSSLGWKEHWQVTGGEFHPDFARRLGTQPPRITDPRQLGVMGRGRAVRGRLEEASRGSSQAYLSQQTDAERALVSLNNVVGWTYVTGGLKGREVQPRISLTHVWDAPPAFWNSSADTGWMPEAYSQAINILRTDYAGDVAEARRHATGLTELLTRVLNGVDADRNGTVEPRPMEGGLAAAVAAVGRTTLRAER